MDQETPEFSTQDLNLSATLLVKGFVLKEIVKTPKGKATFVFTPDDQISLIIQGYWDNNLKVNPQDLFNAIKLLKNRIYSSY